MNYESDDCFEYRDPYVCLHCDCSEENCLHKNVRI